MLALLLSLHALVGPGPAGMTADSAGAIGDAYGFGPGGGA